LIYLWKEGDSRVYLLAVYFKGEKEEISKTEIERLLKNLNKELK
jgi:hypothetical protein